jgi:hypothetical protein
VVDSAGFSTSLTTTHPCICTDEKTRVVLIRAGAHSISMRSNKLLICCYAFVRRSIGRDNLLPFRFIFQQCKDYPKMAEYIHSKTVSQCRSHFQKILKKYGSVMNFLQIYYNKSDRDLSVTKNTSSQTNFLAIARE